MRDGVVDANETNPIDVDTDGDGLSDGVEDANKMEILTPESPVRL